MTYPPPPQTPPGAHQGQCLNVDTRLLLPAAAPVGGDTVTGGELGGGGGG